jgi:AmiR/NasT family two-component response regulator
MSKKLEHPTRVLVVDDNEVVRQTVLRVLNRVGYEVVGEASNGVEAVEITENLRPNLVLMDVEMPKLSGIEAAREIQRRCPTPVILVTAYDSPELIRQAGDAGVMAYLVKPLEAGEMMRTAEIALARFRGWVKLQALNEKLEKRNAQLQRAVDRIETLHELLPVCAWCGRKVQREDGVWVSIESYIESHSTTELTHGICPDCLDKMRGGLPKKKE